MRFIPQKRTKGRDAWGADADWRWKGNKNSRKYRKYYDDTEYARHVSFDNIQDVSSWKKVSMCSPGWSNQPRFTWQDSTFYWEKGEGNNPKFYGKIRSLTIEWVWKILFLMENKRILTFKKVWYILLNTTPLCNNLIWEETIHHGESEICNNLSQDNLMICQVVWLNWIFTQIVSQNQ